VAIGPIDNNWIKKLERYKTHPNSVPIWKFAIYELELNLGKNGKYSVPGEIMPLRTEIEEELLIPMLKKGEIKGYRVLKR